MVARLREELKEHDVHEANKIFIATQQMAMENGEKPTKYFFDLLKKKQEKHNFTQVNVPIGRGKTKISNDIIDILKISTSFYKNLYKVQENLIATEQQSIIDLIDCQLDINQQNDLDADISKEEFRTALAETQNGKTPGWDGLSYEFYKTFWSLLEEDFLQIQNHILNVEKSLTPSQQRALTSLLYKKWDKKDLKNWRPLSLLCTDYKLITKALANRIKKVLPSIIHTDQTCGVPNRTIHENLFLTRDIIEYTNQKRIPGYIITVDQEKAFDRVDRKFLFKILKKFNFGDKIIQWLEIIYQNPKSALYINLFISYIHTNLKKFNT